MSSIPPKKSGKGVGVWESQKCARQWLDILDIGHLQRAILGGSKTSQNPIGESPLKEFQKCATTHCKCNYLLQPFLGIARVSDLIAFEGGGEVKTTSVRAGQPSQMSLPRTRRPEGSWRRVRPVQPEKA